MTNEYIHFINWIFPYNVQPNPFQGKGKAKTCASSSLTFSFARVWGDVTRKRADEVWVRS